LPSESSTASTPRQAFEHLAHAAGLGRIIDVDMRDLMVRNRKSATRSRIEQLSSQLFAHYNEAGLAQRTVYVDRQADVADPILRQNANLTIA
jgi:hypothetical protein